GLAAEMVTAWERRHAIVHSGKTRHLSLPEFRKFFDVIDSFIKPTDTFVVAFLNAHPAPRKLTI
ncbi:MAG: hypothetical protein M3Y57_15395, partial [Acidobacteriota bacterium]|nr:hypothetical protein [Acidobacteriota bacterium]